MTIRAGRQCAGREFGEFATVTTWACAASQPERHHCLTFPLEQGFHDTWPRSPTVSCAFSKRKAI